MSSPRRLALIASLVVLVAVTGLLVYNAVAGQPGPVEPPPWRGPTEPVELKIDGVPGLKMYLEPTDQVITPRIVYAGIWEENETYWLTKTVKPGDTVIDVGANAGYYTVIASRLVGETGRVFAFEPDPDFAELIRRNVRLNGLTNVVVEQKALSDRPGTLKLFLADRNKGDHRVYQPEGEARRSVDVEAVAFDDYWKAHGGRVDFVKIDTQGAEGVILEGMKGVLAGRADRPALFLEFWPSALKNMGSDAGSMLAMLKSRDYRFYDMGLHGRRPLREVQPADLLAEHTVEKKDSQTNLFVLKNGRPVPQE